MHVCTYDIAKVASSSVEDGNSLCLLAVRANSQPSVHGVGPTPSYTALRSYAVVVAAVVVVESRRQY